MEFRINRALPLSIKEQLKRQIRGMINSRVLRPGESMPSCSDMSAILSINRNTVATVYAELSSEGILTSNRGAGTMVSQTAEPKTEPSLSDIIDRAFNRAQKLGFTNEQITDQFFSSLAAHTAAPPKTILMVWCDPMTTAEVGETLKSKLGVRIKSLLVEEIREDPERAEKALHGVDLVVTSLSYIESILPFAQKRGVEVTGLILTPAGRVLNEIVRLPKGTTLGFVCVNNLAAKSTCKGVHLSGQVSLHTIWAGADDAEKLKGMISECDVIFATHHVYEQVSLLSGKEKKIIRLDVSLTDSNIQMIRERLVNP